MKRLAHISKSFSTIAMSIVLLLLGFPAHGPAQPPEVEWLEGPRTVDLGKNVAQIRLAEGYLFANAKDTSRLMEYIGNPPSGGETGLIIPDGEGDWYIVFQYERVGYIRDDEKNDLDSNTILESIRRGTEEANKKRIKMGFTPLRVVGWYEEPHYDRHSNNLVWALLAEGQEGEVVNYNVRLLGRYGFMSVTLVTSPSILAHAKPEIENTIASFSYKTGNKYAEFVKGDKVAQYGLTALIAGGAGAAAVKVGFFKMLAKAWKVVAAALMALVAALSRFIKRMLGGRRQGLVSQYDSSTSGSNT